MARQVASCAMALLLLLSASGATGQAIGTKVAVKREDGKVWLEGVPFLDGRRKGEDTTTIGTLAYAMELRGQDVSYEYLMGVSGQAFRFQLSQRGKGDEAKPWWCGSSPHAACGFNTGDIAYSAIPLKTKHIAAGMAPKGKQTNLAAAKKAVVESIDAGMPVVAGSEEDGLIVGYVNGGEKVLWHSYWSPPDACQETAEWPWGIVTFGAKKTPDPHTMELRSLELAVSMPTVAKFATYDAGFKGMARWSNELRDDNRYESLPKEASGSDAQMNVWIYHSLIGARYAAAGYVRSIADHFGPTALPHLSAAADLYQKEAETLDAAHASVQFPRPGQDVKVLTREQRHTEADALDAAIAIERQAHGEMKKALAAAAR